MRRVIIWSGLLAAPAVAALIIFSGQGKSSRIEPVALPDGSTEYTLVDSGEDKVRGTSDDRAWVLRVAPDIKVTDPDAGLSKLDEERGYTFNSTLFFHLQAEVAISGGSRSTSEIHVLVEAPVVPLGEYRYAVYSPDFATKIFFKSEIQCSLGPEISPGVIMLRPPLSEARQEKEQTHNPENDTESNRLPGADACGQENGQSDYSLHKRTGEAIGYGRCSPDSLCSFFVWLPQSRLALISFPASDISAALSHYEYVSTFFSEITAQCVGVGCIEGRK